MEIKIKNKRLKDVLTEMSNCVVTPQENEYYFLPYWFQIKGRDIYIHSLDNLPDDLTDFIKSNREYREEELKDEIRRYPLTEKDTMSKDEIIIYHGGCYGCTMQIEHGINVCCGCQHKEANWDLPNLSNDQRITHDKKNG